MTHLYNEMTTTLSKLFQNHNHTDNVVNITAHFNGLKKGD